MNHVGGGELEDHGDSDGNPDVVGRHDVILRSKSSVGAGVAGVPRPLMRVHLDADGARRRLGTFEVPEVPVHVGERVDEKVPVHPEQDHGNGTHHQRDGAAGPVRVQRGTAPVFQERPDHRRRDYGEDHRDGGKREMDELVDAEAVHRHVVRQSVAVLRYGRRGHRPPPRIAYTASATTAYGTAIIAPSSSAS